MAVGQHFEIMIVRHITVACLAGGDHVKRGVFEHIGEPGALDSHRRGKQPIALQSAQAVGLAEEDGVEGVVQDRKVVRLARDVAHRDAAKQVARGRVGIRQDGQLREVRRQSSGGFMVQSQEGCKGQAKQTNFLDIH